MKRVYADLHLCPNLSDPKQAHAMISKASKLGYHLIAITFPSNYTEDMYQRIRSFCAEARIEMASRVDLRPRMPNDLLRDLRHQRRRFEIVSVICDSKNVSRQAAKDRRVDLLNFPSVDFRRRFFDLAEAKLASDSVASLEIDMKPLLVLEGPERVRLLSSLRREVAIAKGSHVPLVISSAVSNEMLMRKPQELATVASLFDLDKEAALDAVSKNAVTIVKRNRRKLSPQFVAPGIRVIRRGKDC